MMNYDLPESVELSGQEYAINFDFRCILDVMEVLNDRDLTGQERGFLALGFFYPDFEAIPPERYEEAVKKLYWFIRGGEDEEPSKKQPKLMDWEQDFRYIIAPINKIAGHDVRADKHLHWWTFLSCYLEIGESLFSNIVRIRQLKAEGKQLDKTDAAWYRKNREIVDLKTKYTDTENEILSMWGGG